MYVSPWSIAELQITTSAGEILPSTVPTDDGDLINDRILVHHRVNGDSPTPVAYLPMGTWFEYLGHGCYYAYTSFDPMWNTGIIERELIVKYGNLAHCRSIDPRTNRGNFNISGSHEFTINTVNGAIRGSLPPFTHDWFLVEVGGPGPEYSPSKNCLTLFHVPSPDVTAATVVPLEYFRRARPLTEKEPAFSPQMNTCSDVLRTGQGIALEFLNHQFGAYLYETQDPMECANLRPCPCTRLA